MINREYRVHVLAIAGLFWIASSTMGEVVAAEVDMAGVMQAADRARGGGLPGIAWKVDVEAVRESVKQTRTLLVRAKGGDSLVEFLQPAKVAGQKLLTLGSNLWFIRPGLQRPVSLSPRQRLLGDAANGDIAATNYSADYRPKLLHEERVGSENCYVIELSASADGVTYDKIIYFVSVARQVAVKAQFYSVSGRLFKTALFEYANRTQYRGSTAPFISTMTIADAIEVGSSTVLRYSDVVISELPASAFNLNLLSR